MTCNSEGAPPTVARAYTPVHPPVHACRRHIPGLRASSLCERFTRALATGVPPGRRACLGDPFRASAGHLRAGMSLPGIYLRAALGLYARCACPAAAFGTHNGQPFRRRLWAAGEGDHRASMSSEPVHPTRSCN